MSGSGTEGRFAERAMQTRRDKDRHLWCVSVLVRLSAKTMNILTSQVGPNCGASDRQFWHSETSGVLVRYERSTDEIQREWHPFYEDFGGLERQSAKAVSWNVSTLIVNITYSDIRRFIELLPCSRMSRADQSKSICWKKSTIERPCASNCQQGIWMMSSIRELRQA